ncbi:MAG: CPBP family intramembrane metalloprotease [Coxiellaceae bacterium]|nr:CPBP family intramembrane metalloprotease [Coxiellaceae bacterium]
MPMKLSKDNTELLKYTLDNMLLPWITTYIVLQAWCNLPQNTLSHYLCYLANNKNDENDRELLKTIYNLLGKDSYFSQSTTRSSLVANIAKNCSHSVFKRADIFSSISHSLYKSTHTLRFYDINLNLLHHLFRFAAYLPLLPFWLLASNATNNLIKKLESVIFAPIGEELLYRGLLQSGVKKMFQKTMGRLNLPFSNTIIKTLAIVIQAIPFAATHNLKQSRDLLRLGVGIYLGAVYEKTGSLLTVVSLHSLWNLTYHFINMNPQKNSELTFNPEVLLHDQQTIAENLLTPIALFLAVSLIRIYLLWQDNTNKPEIDKTHRNAGTLFSLPDTNTEKTTTNNNDARHDWHEYR